MALIKCREDTPVHHSHPFKSNIFDGWLDEFQSLQHSNIKCIQLGRGVTLYAYYFAIICLYATTLVLFLLLSVLCNSIVYISNQLKR